MDYAALKAELQADPQGLGYAALLAVGNDSGLADLLNDPSTGGTLARPMRIGDFANWLAGAGLLRKINDAKTHTDEHVSSAALLLMFKIQGDPGRFIDPNDKPTLAMVGTFVTTGIVGEDTVAAFVAACTGPASRAEVLTGTSGAMVTALEVEAVRKGNV